MSHKLLTESEYLTKYPINSKEYNPITHGVIQKRDKEEQLRKNKKVVEVDTERDRKLKQFKG